MVGRGGPQRRTSSPLEAADGVEGFFDRLRDAISLE